MHLYLLQVNIIFIIFIGKKIIKLIFINFYLDMFNHRRPAYTNWGFCEDKGGFMLKASEDIRRGD